MEWRTEATFPDVAGSVGGARRFVEQALRRYGLDALGYAATLVVSELATNALRHAGTPFRVAVGVAPPSLVVEVADGSPALPVPAAAPADAVGGRGLSLLGALAQRWGTTLAGRDGVGKTVWFALPLPGAGCRPAAGAVALPGRSAVVTGHRSWPPLVA